MTAKFVLFQARHSHTEIDSLMPIFVGIDPMKFDRLEAVAEAILSPHAGTSITVYVTGLTQATVAIINACRRLNIGLTLMHYDRDTDSYVPQAVETRGVEE